MTIELSLLNVQGAIHQGFWHEYTPVISAAATVLSLFIIGFQCWIFNRQTKIAEQANTISEKITFLPTQQKVLWDWLEVVQEVKIFFGKVIAEIPNEGVEVLACEGHELHRKLARTAHLSSCFFYGTTADEFKKWNVNGTNGKLYRELLYSLFKIANTSQPEEKDKDNAQDKAEKLLDKLVDSNKTIIKSFNSL